jgi:hypothetical protein
MKKLLLFVGLVFGSFSVLAQMTSEQALEKISFIKGQWQGTANVTTGPGQNIVLDQHENIELMLGGKLLSIEGKGYNDGKLEFNAFAVVTFDESKQEYEMQSWLSTGEKTKAYIKVHNDDQWEWGFDLPQGKVRYFISLNEKGQWTEKGEFSPNGSNWYPSFSMLLDRK